MVLSTLALAFFQDISTFFVDLFKEGQGSRDSESSEMVVIRMLSPLRMEWLLMVWQESRVVIAFATASFFLLDFALNA